MKVTAKPKRPYNREVFLVGDLDENAQALFYTTKNTGKVKKDLNINKFGGKVQNGIRYKPSRQFNKLS